MARLGQMATTYTTTGSVRGSCGHNHRTLATAFSCLDSDQDGCASQGGYSDRQVMAVENGEERPLAGDEADELDRIERDACCC